jgi:hypothetical protein
MIFYRDILHNDLYIKAGGSGNKGWSLINRFESTAHVGYAQLDADDHPQYILDTVVNAKGDLLVATADATVTRLAVGTDGQRLKADSTQTAGVKWG